MRPTPIHSRRPSSKPKQRSASTARKTRPPEITAWTSEIGASASAATCSTQATSATAKPIAHHLERKSARGARERVAHVDVRGRDGTPVLPEEGEVRRECACEREQKSDLYGHGGGIR